MQERREIVGPYDVYLQDNLSDFPDASEFIFFLHGYPDTHDTWQWQLETLSKKYPCVALDLPGAGNSKKPQKRADMNINALVRMISNLFEKIAPNKKVHVVGHDWGALILWVLVSRSQRNQAVKSYTAISGPHPGLARDEMMSKLLSLQARDLWDFSRQALSSWYVYFFQVPGVAEFLWQVAPQVLWRRMLRSAELPATDPYYQLTDEEIRQRAVGTIDLYRELLQGRPVESPSRVSVPVQLIIPERDFALTPELYANVPEIVPHLQLEELQGNHWIHREKPETVNRLLDAFVKIYSN